MTIHAYAALSPETDLIPFTYPESLLQDNEVEIAILYCGLCYSDIHTINNDWHNTMYPHVPGHEIIGKVIKKGKSVFHLNIGEVVGVGWQCYACLNCEFCLKNNETVCLKKLRTTLDRYGGFAERIVIDSHFAYLIPLQLVISSAAPLLCAGITVYSPFMLYPIEPLSSVAIIGVGGLGHLAIQFARALGYSVTAISHSPSKEKEALKFGANRFIHLDEVKKLKTPVGLFDFILSTVQASLDWEEVVSWLRPGGKLCFVGIPPQPIAVSSRLLISGNRTICGSGTGSRKWMKDMLQFCASHHIQPQVEMFRMKNINQAINHLKRNQVRYRIVLEP